jgi:hypothetical protein
METTVANAAAQEHHTRGTYLSETGDCGGGGGGGIEGCPEGPESERLGSTDPMLAWYERKKKKRKKEEKEEILISLRGGTCAGSGRARGGRV